MMSDQPYHKVKRGAEIGNPSTFVSSVGDKANNGPQSKREMTTREKIILLQSSKLNGQVYPPWTSSTGSDIGQINVTDDGGLSLSEDQLEVFDGWRRAGDIWKTAQPNDNICPTMVATKAIDLVQDVTNDCSVIASLCAASARLASGRSDVILRNIYPRDTELQQPVISSSGIYIVRLHFNGCSRRVVIDDRLPASRTSQKLHVIDRNNPGLLWPALVEKAYLKIRGGYDFPGSNSGTDLWALTGWIPEQLFIQSDDVVRSSLWRRLYNAFNYGDVLITMGTGTLTQNEEDCTGLVGEHDYAVIDVKEYESQQLFLVKNPWSEGTSWKGQAFCTNAVTEIRANPANLGVTDSNDWSTVNGDSLPVGTFWMRFNDVFQSFQSIYLNWNPSLFSWREDVHFYWDLSECKSPEGSFASNPQYAVRSNAGGTVWLLLNRHFTLNESMSGSQYQGPASLKPDLGFMSLYAFYNDGERVFLSDEAAVRGPYVDSPNTLLKIELARPRVFTIVISGQALPCSRNLFTLSVFSLTPVSISEVREQYDHSTQERGVWTTATAGGNASSLSYSSNPQFSLRLAQASSMSLLLENPIEGLPVHVSLVWGKGKQVHSITSRDVITDSGEYRNGFAFARLSDVQAGNYTIVCSTFERGQLGAFTLRVDSTSACTIQRIPVEASGRFVAEVPPAVFEPRISRVLAPLNSRRLNRVSLSARSSRNSSRCDGNTCSPLKLSLEHGLGACKEVLATSDEEAYLDGHVGVRISEANIQRRMCAGRGLWIVVERLACSGVESNEYVHVGVVSDAPIEVGKWGLEQG